MKASDIKDVGFNKGAFGYKIRDVRGFLNELSEFVLSLEEKNYSLDRENKSLKSKLMELEKTQDEIKEIMISAQNFKHKIIKEAEVKTNELVVQAKEKAQKIEEEAKRVSDEKMEEFFRKLNSKKSQLDKLKKEVSDFKAELFKIYKKHLDLISKMPEINDNDNDGSSGTSIEKVDSRVEDSSNYEDESEIFEKFQTQNKFEKNEDSSNFNNFEKNLSGNESIFKQKSSENSDKKQSYLLKNSSGYIKSRFEELNK